MFDKININSSVSAYAQIENEAMFAVASGALKAGDRLPSAQELGKRVNINANTVAKAYRDLQVMEIVYTRRGMGVYINEGAEAKCQEVCRKRIVGRMYEVISEAKAAGMSAVDINSVVKASFESGGSIYGEIPAAVLAVGKKQK